MINRVDDSLFAAVARALADLPTDIEAGECHGMLCGMLSNPSPFDPARWFDHVLGYGEPIQWHELPLDSPLQVMLSETLRGFEADDFSFNPVLPPDAAPLAERAAALGLWCRGFLSGFGVQGAVPSLTAEGREFLHDLAKISQIEPDEADTEMGERAFLDVVEYARMGALLLNAEHPAPVADLPARKH